MCRLDLHIPRPRVNYDEVCKMESTLDLGDQARCLLAIARYVIEASNKRAIILDFYISTVLWCQDSLIDDKDGKRGLAEREN